MFVSPGRSGRGSGPASSAVRSSVQAKVAGALARQAQQKPGLVAESGMFYQFAWQHAHSLSTFFYMHAYIGIQTCNHGVSIVPWKSGKLLVWDATCPDTFAPSYLAASNWYIIQDEIRSYQF